MDLNESSIESPESSREDDAISIANKYFVDEVENQRGFADLLDDTSHEISESEMMNSISQSNFENPLGAQEGQLPFDDAASMFLKETTGFPSTQKARKNQSRIGRESEAMGVSVKSHQLRGSGAGFEENWDNSIVRLRKGDLVKERIKQFSQVPSKEEHPFTVKPIQGRPSAKPKAIENQGEQLSTISASKIQGAPFMGQNDFIQENFEEMKASQVPGGADKFNERLANSPLGSNESPRPMPDYNFIRVGHDDSKMDETNQDFSMVGMSTSHTSALRHSKGTGRLDQEIDAIISRTQNPPSHFVKRDERKNKTEFSSNVVTPGLYDYGNFPKTTGQWSNYAPVDFSKENKGSLGVPSQFNSGSFGQGTTNEMKNDHLIYGGSDNTETKKNGINFKEFQTMTNYGANEKSQGFGNKETISKTNEAARTGHNPYVDSSTTGLPPAFPKYSYTSSDYFMPSPLPMNTNFSLQSQEILGVKTSTPSFQFNEGFNPYFPTQTEAVGPKDFQNQPQFHSASSMSLYPVLPLSNNPIPPEKDLHEKENSSESKMTSLPTRNYSEEVQRFSEKLEGVLPMVKKDQFKSELQRESVRPSEKWSSSLINDYNDKVSELRCYFEDNIKTFKQSQNVNEELLERVKKMEVLLTKLDVNSLLEMIQKQTPKSGESDGNKSGSSRRRKEKKTNREEFDESAIQQISDSMELSPINSYFGEAEKQQKRDEGKKSGVFKEKSREANSDAGDSSKQEKSSENPLSQVANEVKKQLSLLMKPETKEGFLNLAKEPTRRSEYQALCDPLFSSNIMVSGFYGMGSSAPNLPEPFGHNPSQTGPNYSSGQTGYQSVAQSGLYSPHPPFEAPNQYAERRDFGPMHPFGCNPPLSVNFNSAPQNTVSFPQVPSYQMNQDVLSLPPISPDPLFKPSPSGFVTGRSQSINSGFTSVIDSGRQLPLSSFENEIRPRNPDAQFLSRAPSPNLEGGRCQPSLIASQQNPMDLTSNSIFSNTPQEPPFGNLATPMGHQTQNQHGFRSPIASHSAHSTHSARSTFGSQRKEYELPYEIKEVTNESLEQYEEETMEKSKKKRRPFLKRMRKTRRLKINPSYKRITNSVLLYLKETEKVQEYSESTGETNTKLIQDTVESLDFKLKGLSIEIRDQITTNARNPLKQCMYGPYEPASFTEMFDVISQEIIFSDFERIHQYEQQHLTLASIVSEIWQAAIFQNPLADPIQVINVFILIQRFFYLSTMKLTLFHKALILVDPRTVTDSMKVNKFSAFVTEESLRIYEVVEKYGQSVKFVDSEVEIEHPDDEEKDIEDVSMTSLKKKKKRKTEKKSKEEPPPPQKNLNTPGVVTRLADFEGYPGQSSTQGKTPLRIPVLNLEDSSRLEELKKQFYADFADFKAHLPMTHNARNILVSELWKSCLKKKLAPKDWPTFFMFVATSMEPAENQ